jgi:hypothetical protein
MFWLPTCFAILHWRDYHGWADEGHHHSMRNHLNNWSK